MATLLVSLKSQKDDVVQQIAQLRLTIKDLDIAIEALENKSVIVRKPSQRQDGSLTLKEAVLLALSEMPLNTDSVFTSVLTLGHETTTKPSIASTLSRLKADGAVVKVDGDKWTVQENQNSPNGNDQLGEFIRNTAFDVDASSAAKAGEVNIFS